MTDSPSVEALLSQATFTPVYRDWLGTRDGQIAARLRTLPVTRETRVLLLNATMGLPLYPSVVDFFALLQRTHPRIRVTSASYFDDIYQLGEEVTRKGLERVSIADVLTWTVADVNRYDVVLAIGPSDALAGMMSIPGIKPRLLLLDLAFYHQLIESTQGAFLVLKNPDQWAAWVARRQPSRAFQDGYSRAWIGALKDRVSRQQNDVVCYSCQPENKVQLNDLDRFFNLERFTWRWFNYIPIGFPYSSYYRSDRYLFDVVLLGSDGRDYSEIHPEAFHGLKFLFLGAASRAPALARLCETLDVTVVPAVDQDTYARLLALGRCVVLPMIPRSDNVLLSVIDAMASGKVLVTPLRSGLARLASEQAPIVFYDGPEELAARVTDLLGDDARLEDLAARTIAFAKDRLDIYGILETITREQMV